MYRNVGWDEHLTASAEQYANVVDDMLKKVSLNMYMFIGGTNFGFTSGANHREKFTPVVTSYNYDALLSGCGDITEKYCAVKNLIKNIRTENFPRCMENTDRVTDI